MRLEHPQCSNGTSAYLDGRLVGEQGWTLRAEGHGRGRLLSVGQGLIERDVGNRLGICGIEPGGLIEPQSLDRLKRSWDPNRDPKLPETGGI